MTQPRADQGSPSAWLHPPSVRTTLLALVLLTLSMSVGRWLMEGAPRSYWRDKQPEVRHRWCPDGMDITIRALVETLRGNELAREFYLDRLRTSHQASTMLVEWSCAPLVLAGLEEAVAFAIVSSLASLLLVGLLWRLARDCLDTPRDRLIALALFLAHPGTVRCFSRPQTDALLALFAMAVWMGGRRMALEGPSGGRRRFLLVVASAACFVKIHAVSLLAIAPAVAFLHGARSRRLGEVVLLGSVLPALLWLGVFFGLDLFGSIQAAWEYKARFYGQLDAVRILQVLALTSGPLLALAALHPRGSGGLAPSAWLLVAGFAAILLVSSIPPLVRFQYPALAPLCVCAVAAVRRRLPEGAGTVLLMGLLCLWYLIDAALVGIDLYGRYLGNPARKVPELFLFLQ